MKKRKSDRVLRALAAFLLCAAVLSLFPAGLADSPAALHIGSAEELLAFAKSCSLDSYSEGLTVYLDCDLDLTGAGFSSIPTFSGVFNGGGHTVSGLSLTGPGSHVGFFRYIQAGGQVRNLNVSGTVAPTGSMSMAGGIAGTNMGSIIGCAFTGTVTGETSVGGVAGVNESTGTVSRCSSAGAVSGRHNTGGVVGLNQGLVDGCTNRAAVNVTAVDELPDLDTIDISLLNSTENVSDVTDTGGVAGISPGEIRDCTNYGTVGCERTGYNTGGIAGRQSGYLTGCLNYGAVWGRKEVGGIVGQAEPYMTVDTSKDAISRLYDEINTLHDLISKTLTDARDVSGSLSAGFTSVNSYTNAMATDADFVAERLSQVADATVANVNDIMSRVDYVMDNAGPLLTDLSSSVSDLTGSVQALEQVVKDLDIQGAMGEEYDESKYAPVAITCGTGGTVTADNTNPAAGATVALHASPQAGYRLVSLTVTERGGGNVPLSVVTEGLDYTFVMPAASGTTEVNSKARSVTVLAKFALLDPGDHTAALSGHTYTNRTERLSADTLAIGSRLYLDQTVLGGDNPSAAGSVQADSLGSLVTLRAAASPGYTLQAVTAVKNADGLPVAVTADPTGQLYTLTVPTGSSGAYEDVVVSAVFLNTAADTAGGTVTQAPYFLRRDSMMVINVSPASGYPLGSLTVTDSQGAPVAAEASVAGSLYTITVPDEQALTVSAAFRPTQIDVTSNPGGTVSALVSGDQVTLNIRYADGYALQDLTVTDGGGAAVAYRKQTDNGTVFTFPLPAGGYAAVRATFVHQTSGGTVAGALADLRADSARLSAASAGVSADVASLEDFFGYTYNSASGQWVKTGTSPDLTDETARTRLESLLLSLAENLGGTVSAGGAVMDDISTAVTVLTPYLTDAAGAANADLAAALSSLESAGDRLSAALTDAQNILSHLNALPDIRFPTLGDDYYTHLNSLSDNLKGLSGSMEALNQTALAGSVTLTGDLQQVNDQLSVVMLLMVDALDGVSDVDVGAILQDESDEDTPENHDGKVAGSVNYGAVSGDLNAGGIAGAMAVEYDFDPESDVTGFSDTTLTATYLTKCVLRSCVNRGTVSVRNDTVGAVVGLMELGSVIACQGYGRVRSESGDYVGGIAGQSHSTVRECWAMCRLEGADSVGGIVGQGYNVNDCVSLVLLDCAGECSGAVAGELPGGTWERNVFVSDTLAGVDGISYAGKAEPATYDSLLERTDLPDDFRRFTLTFRADGQVLAVLDFPYGGSIDPASVPAIPEKDGCWADWPDYDFTHLVFSDTLDAIYTSCTAVIEAAARRTGDDRPVALADGSFGPGGSVVLTPSADSVSLAGNMTLLEAWQAEITDLRSEDGTCLLRYRLPDAVHPGGSLRIYRLADGRWSRVSYTSDGSYAVFSVPGGQVTFCAVEVRSPALPWILGGGVLAAAAAALLLLRRRKRVRQ